MDRSRFSSFRVLSIILMLLAWGVASNRCAFAALALKAPAATAEMHKCCSGTAGHDREQPPAKENGECCQKLGGVPLASGSELVKAPAAVTIFELAWSAVAASMAEEAGEGIRQTEGPPKALSFAEVVLQRSVLSHAPPVAV